MVDGFFHVGCSYMGEGYESRGDADSLCTVTFFPLDKSDAKNKIEKKLYFKLAHFNFHWYWMQITHGRLIIASWLRR